MAALTPHDLSPAAQPPGGDLEALLADVEQRLALLGAALRDRNAPAIESHASELHRALATAIQRFAQSARQHGGVPLALRQRLALAGGEVAAQRESLARATAALDRAIDVLMPVALATALYGQAGQADRPATSGCLHA
jgi:hypothetical protein